MNSWSQTVYALLSSFLLVWKIYHYYWCCKQKKIEGEVRRTVSRTLPIWLNIAYSIGWGGDETETHVFKMAVKLKYNITSLTIMRKKFLVMASFHNPLHSQWSLPLNKSNKMWYSSRDPVPLTLFVCRHVRAGEAAQAIQTQDRRPRINFHTRLASQLPAHGLSWSHPYLYRRNLHN
jgi:hypothetical protein